MTTFLDKDGLEYFAGKLDERYLSSSSGAKRIIELSTIIHTDGDNNEYIDVRDLYQDYCYIADKDYEARLILTSTTINQNYVGGSMPIIDTYEVFNIYTGDKLIGNGYYKEVGAQYADANAFRITSADRDLLLKYTKTLVEVPIPMQNYGYYEYTWVTKDLLASGGVTSYNDLTDKPDLKTVATSGSYNDLDDKPTIPTVPTLATVATSGSYNDLDNKPTIPTVPSTLDFINIVYPVGSIYMSWNSTDPGTLFTGTTWERLSGRYLYATADTSSSQTTTTGATTIKASGNTGTANGNTGEASGNTGASTGNTGASTGSTGETKLTAAQSGLPAHNHGLVFHYTDGHYGGSTTEVRARDTDSNWTSTYDNTAAGASSGHTHPLNNHTHSLNNHTHSLNSHTHTLGNHSHTLGDHTHSMNYVAIFVWKRTK